MQEMQRDRQAESSGMAQIKNTGRWENAIGKLWEMNFKY